MMHLPDDIRAGDPISARWLNAVKNAVMRDIVGDGWIGVHRTGNKLTIKAGEIPKRMGLAAGFWARITGLREVGEEEQTDADGYDWVRMDAVDGELIESDPAITGSGTAWEVNDVGVNPGTIVWMRPAGQVQDGEEDSEPVMVPAYLFRAAVGGGFWALLGGNTTIGDNRWSYSFQEATYQKLGEFMPGGQGRSGTAYNAIESGNQFAGTQGNGIETSALPGGVTMRPIGAGAVVWMREVINCETNDVEYVFEAVNAIGGACD